VPIWPGLVRDPARWIFVLERQTGLIVPRGQSLLATALIVRTSTASLGFLFLLIDVDIAGKPQRLVRVELTHLCASGATFNIAVTSPGDPDRPASAVWTGVIGARIIVLHVLVRRPVALKAKTRER
jgi:hypothetical protein